MNKENLEDIFAYIENMISGSEKTAAPTIN